VTSVLCVGDIHVADRPPSSCTSSYLDDILDLLWETVRVARERSVDAVVWAGDVFHHKAPSRTSHRTMQRVLEVAEAYEGRLHVVPGNHDMQWDREDSVAQTQPLGVLLRHPAVHLLKGWANGLPLYGVPWIQGYGSDPEAVRGKVAGALASYRDANPSGCLVVTHAPLYEPGTELQFEYFPAAGWAEAMGGVGCCYYGHVHEYHGQWSVGEVTFCNVGAISRGSLDEYNLLRKVKVALWTAAAGFEEIVLPHKPASEVFRLADKTQLKTARVSMEEFLAAIGQTTVGAVSVEAVVARLREMPDLKRRGELVPLVEKLLTEAG
jgi:predicted phosphodiesterase